MRCAVLDAYGWTELSPVYDFRVQRDERVRYTWDDDTRDEVLPRLRSLHRQRAAAEAANAPPPDATKGTRRKGAATGGTNAGSTPAGDAITDEGGAKAAKGKGKARKGDGGRRKCLERGDRSAVD